MTEQGGRYLIPDLISIPCIDGQDWFIIFDAKYYNLQLEKGKSLRGNPGVGDVTKQYRISWHTEILLMFIILQK